MVRFCFDSSYFTYDSTLYLQLDGNAMGNPLSPTLAVFVTDLVESCLKKLPFTVPFFKLPIRG